MTTAYSNEPFSFTVVKLTLLLYSGQINPSSLQWSN